MSEGKFRIVGKRKPSRDFMTNAAIQGLARSLTEDRTLCKKGVYRFRTFKEADEAKFAEARSRGSMRMKKR